MRFDRIIGKVANRQSAAKILRCKTSSVHNVFAKRRFVCSALGLFALIITNICCAPTPYYKKQMLADRCMQFDVDDRLIWIRNKAEAAREGSFGGFGGSTAGGCGCQ